MINASSSTAGGTVQPAPVPEPGSLLIFTLALGGALLRAGWAEPAPRPDHVALGAAHALQPSHLCHPSRLIPSLETVILLLFPTSGIVTAQRLLGIAQAQTRQRPKHHPRRGLDYSARDTEQRLTRPLHALPEHDCPSSVR